MMVSPKASDRAGGRIKFTPYIDRLVDFVDAHPGATRMPSRDGSSSGLGCEARVMITG
jgi:hypothetical protein